MATIVATSLEAPCRARTSDFVATLWPLYLKFDEMTLNGVMSLTAWKYRVLSPYCLSCRFAAVPATNCMGCKGSRVQISALRPVFQSMPENPGGPVSGPMRLRWPFSAISAVP